MKIFSQVYYGENEIADQNKSFLKLTVFRLPKKPAGEAKAKDVFAIDIYGKLSMQFYSLDNGNRATASANLKDLLEEENVVLFSYEDYVAML